MAALIADEAEDEGTRLFRTVLRSYAQVLFSRSPHVGAMLLAATATSPRVFVFGLGAVLVALFTARLLGLDRQATEEGVFGYNALLVGLGIGATFTGVAPAVPAMVLSAFATVIGTAALRSWLGALGLPVLSIPFLAVFWLLLGAAHLTHLPYGPFDLHAGPLDAALPSPVLAYARSLGALFFVPHAEAGLLVLAALALHSRIAVTLSALALVAVLALERVTLSLAEPSMVYVLGYNAALAAIALGGVWFVPSRSSFLLALVGVLLGALVNLGSWPALARLGLPALVLPFNATMTLLFLALRQRARDERPKAVDFPVGSPEENLAYWRTRVARFGALHPVRFRLPVLGRWTCTQAEEGRLTHKGPWRHAFDFEVEDGTGQRHRGEGKRVEEYLAWKLPVVAAAAGTVVKVIDGVRDNAVGQIDVEHNWGNLVVLQHAPGLFSLVAHLARGSIHVREGELVAAGAPLGACGSSGRSPSPHVHFQLQAAATPGAATLPCRFSDVVIDDEGTPRVEDGFLPREGGALRALEPSGDGARFLRFRYGDVLRFRCGAHTETIECDLDLLGQSLLRSRETGAVLHTRAFDGLFIAYEVLGGESDVLTVLEAALARVPLELDERLVWRDRLSARRHRSPFARALFDFVSPLFEDDSLDVRFRFLREDGRLVVEGRSDEERAPGEPRLRTRAVMERDRGLLRAELRSGDRVLEIERLDNET